MKRTTQTLLALALASSCVLTFITTARAQDAAAVYMEETAELAKKLQNPVAALISVPLQNNFEFNGGPKNDGFRYQLNLHPVVPFSLNEDWNLISRTILPFISQEDMVAKGSSQTGLGDTVQSLFFSPRSPTYGGVIWAVGPVFQLPTATDDLLGEEKWGAGPTALALRQHNGWTYGALFNHIWSFAGESGPPGREPDLPATFRCVYHQDLHHVWLEHRDELRLDWRTMDRAAHRQREPGAQGRQIAGQLCARREVLRRGAQRRARVGVALRGHVPISQVKQIKAGG